MNHAVTVGGLLSVLALLAGFATVLIGALSAFGNMMADTAGDNGKAGCITIAAGIVLMGLGLWGVW
jgi:hypothetical protein